MSLRKTFKVGSHSIVLLGEVFNLFNTDQFNLPGTSITSGLFGQRTSVRGTRTFQIGAHYRF